MQHGIRRSAREIKQAIERVNRNRLVFPSSGAQWSPPTVYFLTPDYNIPSGGIRVIYRHVDILNSNGIRAKVMHQSEGFRCDWFDNRTPVAGVRNTLVGPDDLVVVGELDVDLVARNNPAIRHVIFNQNAFMTWTRGVELVSRHYASAEGLVGVLTVSDHSREMLHFAFPTLDIRTVTLSIDPGVFRPPTEPPPNRITFMPRKDPGQLHASTTRGLLHGSPHMLDWTLHPLDALSHEEVANELRSSRIFLAFTAEEGFGLPAAEAMACGNYVIGFHGFGGLEFFSPEFSAPIESGDFLALSRALLNAFDSDLRSPGWLRERGEAAAAFIHSKYSPDSEARQLVDTYTEFLGHL